MKIAYNWLKDFIELDQSPEQLAKHLTDIGLEVESIDQYENIRGGLQNVVVGQVLTCEKHPNADKLRVTTVEVGNGEVLPIVCGAPNVAAGQKVMVAKVGAVLYPIDADKPLEITKAKIRGEVSEGMICAEDELGLGHSHEGIIVLPSETPIGKPAAELYNAVSETFFEIGLTPNRVDAASHLGVARDLAALLKKEVHLPESHQITFTEGKTIRLLIEDELACPYYSGAVIKGINVAPSPEWLANRLKAIGIRPINNVVDITNYVLHELGNPLHAFDLDHITANEIKVGYSASGTLFETLDGVVRKLSGQELMIKNQTQPMCMAGVMGGKLSGVTENTKDIFLEAAYFHPDRIRKASQLHGLKTDSSFRFERGTDPIMPPKALARAVKLILEIAGGNLVECVASDSGTTKPYHIVEANLDRIRHLLGISITDNEMLDIFQRLEMKVANINDKSIVLQVPSYRVDVTREADLAEDILRIVGLDQVPLSPQLGTSFLAEHPEFSTSQIAQQIGNHLAHQGYFEIVSNSITSTKKTKWLKSLPPESQVQILNPLSEELNVMRPSMLFSGLEAISYNVNRKQKDLKLFELGKTYHRNGSQFKENSVLSIWLTGQYFTENWRQPQRPADFYDLAETVFSVFLYLGVFPNAQLKQGEIGDEFSEGVLINWADKTVGKLGKVKNELLKECGIKQPVLWGTIDFELLFNEVKSGLKIKEISKFPEVKRDLSLVIDKKVSFDELKKVALSKKIKELKDINLFDVYEGEKIEKDKKAYALSFLLQPTDRTLTDEEVDQAMNLLINSFESEFNAVIRK